MQKTIEPAALTVKSVAIRYAISVRSVYKLIDSKDLPCGIKLGKSRRWLVKDLEAWEQTRSKGGLYAAR